MLAYDIAILAQAADRAGPECHGWCFGLPPGIQPSQWPPDPANGYPLQHSFTLLLPEDHRCHGPEIVAVSFFASAMEHNDGPPLVKAPAIRKVMNGVGAPTDPTFSRSGTRCRQPIRACAGSRTSSVALTRPSC